MSTLNDKDRVRLLDRLTRHPPELIHGMITIPDEQWARSSNLSTSSDEEPNSIIGAFEVLPLELMHRILSFLDFKTLMDFTRTTRSALIIIHSLIEYRSLMKHAPQALAALAQTRLLRSHSLGALHHTLSTSECISCGAFGAFLFLPTCERCCNACLDTNPSLRVITTDTAKQVFRLRTLRLKQLPTMETLSGSYYSGIPPVRMRQVIGSQECNFRYPQCSTPWRSHVVAVKAVKALALASTAEQRLPEDYTKHRPRSDASEHGAQWLLDAALQWHTSPPWPNLGGVAEEYRRFQDRFYFMASTPFPYVRSSGKVEQGHWCRGCQYLVDRHYLWDPKRPPWKMPEEVRRLIPEEKRVEQWVEARALMARSEEEFAVHAVECWGARSLEAELLGAENRAGCRLEGH